jgi:FkbM family methyltransferase
MLDLITDPNKNLQSEIEKRYKFSHYEVCGKLPNRLKNILLNDNLHNINVDEKTRKTLLKKFRLKEDDVFLEVGTYYGFGTVKLSQNVKKVIGIEADKYNFWMTKRNVEKNCDNVILINKAVGKEKGKQKFYSREKEIGQGKSFFKESLKNKIKNSYEVEVDTIDNILNDLNLIRDITFVSLEINLAEIDALLGMSKTLENKMRLLIAGWYDYKGRPASFTIKEILNKHGFSVYIGVKNRVYAIKE